MKKILLKLVPIAILTTPIISVISCAEKEKQPVDKEELPELIEGTTKIEFIYEGDDYGSFNYDDGWKADEIDPDKFDAYIVALDGFYNSIPKLINTTHVDLKVQQFIGGNNEINVDVENVPVDRLILEVYDPIKLPELVNINDFWTRGHIDLEHDGETLAQLNEALALRGAKERYTENAYAVTSFIEAVASNYNFPIDYIIKDMDFPAVYSDHWNASSYDDAGPIFEIVTDTFRPDSDADAEVAKEKIKNMFGLNAEQADKFLTDLINVPPFYNYTIKGYKNTNSIVISFVFQNGYSYSSFLRANTFSEYITPLSTVATL